MNASAFIAASLDGFIARTDGDIDWLGNPGGDAEDYGHRQFLATVDTLVMGRHTYEKVLTFGGWPYEGKSVVVLSTHPVQIPQDIAPSAQVMSGHPAELVVKLAERGAKHLYVDGGKTIQRFLSAGLIQQMIITRIPILLGQGIPLFGPLERDIRLSHIITRSFPNGLVQSTYQVIG